MFLSARYRINDDRCTYYSSNDEEITEEVIEKIIQNMNNSNDIHIPKTFEFYDYDFIFNNNNNQKKLFNKSLDIVSKYFSIIITTDGFNYNIDNISDSVKSLTLGKDFNQPVLQWAKGLKELTLLSTEYTYSLDNLPDSIEYLELNKCTVPIKKLPKSLKKLILNSHEILFECEITENIETIVINQNNYLNLKNIVKNCKNLELYSNIVSQLDNSDTFSKLESLIIHIGENIGDKIIFPSNLKKLSFFHTTYDFPFDNLPLTLNYFIFHNNTHNFNFDNMPTNLHTFDLSLYSIYKNQLNLPESVKSIKLTNCSLKSINNLPINIEEFEIDYDECYNLDDDDNNNNDNLNALNFVFYTSLSPHSIKKLKIKCNCVVDFLPKSVVDIEFDKYVDIRYFDWDKTNLEKIIFNIHFNYPIDNIKFPNTLKYVNFGNHFNYSIDNLPNSVEEIILGNHHNTEINHFPDNLKKIIFGKKYKYSIDNLPNDVEEITLTSKYDKQITSLPSKLKIISIYSKYKYMNQLVELCNNQNILIKLKN